jgi:enterochelin esterase-like enzyme
MLAQSPDFCSTNSSVKTMNYKAAALLLLGLSLASCSKNGQPAPPDRPRLTPAVKMVDVTFHSAALNRDMPYRAILPVSIAANQKLPVVYLLHGGGGGFHDVKLF